MITKEQFLAGVEFRVAKEAADFRYEYKCLTRRTIRDFNYCANVSRISDDGFECFTFLFHEEVRAFIKFSDCTAIVNEPERAETI